MSNEKFILTIGREYGSGGRIIGKMVAEQLGINFYDKELINITAEKSGFDPEVIARSEQKKTNSFLYNLYMTANDLPITDKIQIFQTKLIKELAQKESCVIVGRCADYILNECPHAYHAFIFAPLESRIKRAQEEYGITENVEQYVKRRDKDRESYYNSFTTNRWGYRGNYNITLDSSVGIDKCVEILKKLIEQ